MHQVDKEEEVAVLLTRIGQEVPERGGQSSHQFLQPSIMSSPGKESTRLSLAFGTNSGVGDNEYHRRTHLAPVVSIGSGFPDQAPFIDSGPPFALTTVPLPPPHYGMTSSARTGLVQAPLPGTESMLGAMPLQAVDPLIALREREIVQEVMREQMLEQSTMGLLCGNTSGSLLGPYQQVPRTLRPPVPQWLPGAPRLHLPFVPAATLPPLVAAPFPPSVYVQVRNHFGPPLGSQSLPSLYQGINRFAFATEQAPPKDLEAPNYEKPALVVDQKPPKRRRISDPFPVRLHRLLLDIEQEGKQDIISFTPSGKAFTVHKESAFIKDIVPRYFRQHHIASFKRQLNVYGFDTVIGGVDGGAFRHVNFQRDKSELLTLLRPKPAFDCYAGQMKQQRNGKR